jgi:hypothetical protein
MVRKLLEHGSLNCAYGVYIGMDAIDVHAKILLLFEVFECFR